MMMFIAGVAGQIIGLAVKLILFPFIAVGYISGFAWGFIYFGWDLSNKHQAACVARYEQRTQSKGQL